ncbi:MAG: hypothetical protein PHO07_07700, partial [Pirellulales bacterium]|nr:hypothetical protein [Pirellulales bacterium]
DHARARPPAGGNDPARRTVYSYGASSHPATRVGFAAWPARIVPGGRRRRGAARRSTRHD